MADKKVIDRKEQLKALLQDSSDKVMDGIIDDTPEFLDIEGIEAQYE